MDIHTPRTSKCCNVLGEREICEIPISQAQSVFDAFYMSVFTHPKDIFPRRGLNTGAKIRKNCEICKKIWRFLSGQLTFLYNPCAILSILDIWMDLLSQTSMVFSGTPRTSAWRIASCLVKSVGSIWKNWRWSILPTLSPTGVVRVETWITPCLRQKSYKSYGNYMRVNTTTDNVTWVMWINNSNNFSNNFRSNQLPRAAQNMIQGVNRYINPNKKRHQ